MKRGQYDGDGTSVVVCTSSNGTASDVEVRVQTVNGSTNTGITVLEVINALEQINAYLANAGFEGNDTVDIPNQTLADHL